MDELIARLRFLAETEPCRNIGAVHDAADALTTLQAREATLIRALTPSAETKAAYIGEFSFTIEDTDDEWGLPITRHIDVPWTTIKEIMAAIRARANVEALATSDLAED